MTNKLSLAILAFCMACAATVAHAQGLRSGGLGGGAAPSTTTGFGLPSLGAPPAANVTREADYIVALVNSEPITRNQLEQAVARVRQQAEGQQQLPPDRVLYPQVLEQLINTRVELQSAKDMGITINDAMVDQVALNIARQNNINDLTELRRRVEGDGMTWSGFRANLREQLTLSRVREQAQSSRTQVSEREIDDYLAAHRQEQQAAANQVNLAQILVAVPENASADQVARLQAKAQGLADQARQPNADFAALARANSDGSAVDREQGGAMGLRPADRYPDLFIDNTRSLPVGGVAGPVRSGAGFHILKVLERPSANVSGGVVVTQTHARHILLRPDAQLTEAQAVTRLGQMRDAILAGRADFATLARQQSQDGSAAEGGDLGWANPGQFVPEFEQALNRLDAGQISEPLVSRFGVHLIQVIERRQGTVSEREQRESVRAILREQKADESYSEWMREIRSRAFVEYRNAPGSAP
ncbi:MAG: Chaperone SurA [Paracidovorax wautersii]|uniref:Chaperone SurA n=1 Tax=Paracidovorax wautersii TaxID=1177982 RepID=A0A7V8FRQ3_9BURK|nr:MAG: Chaperone SurA [Paracidovorax wautersii]